MAGVTAGAAATVSYDAVRYGIERLDLFDFHPFGTIPIFGTWLTGTASRSAMSLALGWTYHVWNGLGLGLFFAFVFRRPTIPVGIAYGLVLEAFMLGLFPLFLTIHSPAGFIVISMAGHVVFGAVLAAVTIRMVAR